MDFRRVAAYVGVAVVIGSHVPMLGDPAKHVHAATNLVAASLILYSLL